MDFLILHDRFIMFSIDHTTKTTDKKVRQSHKKYPNSKLGRNLFLISILFFGLAVILDFSEYLFAILGQGLGAFVAGCLWARSSNDRTVWLRGIILSALTVGTRFLTYN